MHSLVWIEVCCSKGVPMFPFRCLPVGMLLLSVGCGHSQAAQTAPAPPPTVATRSAPKRLPLPAPQLPQSVAIGDVMGDHFIITSWARDSVIAGMLDPLKQPLRVLAAYRYEDVKAGGWMPWIAQLQTAARLTSEAATLDVAASGVATMGRVCGECHRANQRGPISPPVPDLLDRLARETVDERMARHLWAAELLWEGIPGPSDETWRAGAKALIEAPDALDDELPEGFDRSLLEVRGLGQHAEVAETLAERANVYGLLIATCADCHTRFLEYGVED